LQQTLDAAMTETVWERCFGMVDQDIRATMLMKPGFSGASRSSVHAVALGD
jgi:hypothetical protein